MWTCEQGLHLWKCHSGMNCMGGTVWTGYASVNEICTFELPILLRDVNQFTWCFTCKMFARLWMRHTHENEMCTYENLNRVRSCLRNALLWMRCTYLNGIGEIYKCVRICKTPAHLWMEMRICEGKLAVENRATYLLTGHLRCEWDLESMNGTTHVWTGQLTFG